MASAQSPMDVERDERTIELPGDVALSLQNRGGDLLGIGAVTVGGLPLRNPARLWRPLPSSEAGISYSRLRLREIASGGEEGAVEIVLEAVGYPTALMEEQDEYLGDVLNLELSGEPVIDTLRWQLKPSSRTIGGRHLRGFAYRFTFETESAERAIYRLFDWASWEPGGRLQGNTLLLQGQCNPPATSLSIDGSFTTACNYYGAEMRGVTGVPDRVSFQRLPRIGTLQGFDLLACESGALVGLFEPVEEIFSVLQTVAGEDWLHVVDEHRRPRSRRMETHWKHMLVCRPEREWTRTAQRNFWRLIYDHVHEGARRRAGIRRSFVQPRVWVPQISSTEAHLCGHTAPRERFLYTLADHALPQWAEMGVKEICAFSLWKSDYTEDHLLRKQDQASPLHGALIVGSICNVREHVVSPVWGGTEALAHFTERAHELGMGVQLWWASHMSRRAPIFEKHPEFMLRARDGLPNGGGYGHQSIITFDLNNPECFEYIYEHLKGVHDATGVDGLFHDSYGNMTFLPTNYADPQRRGQQEAYARLVVRLQEAGLRQFTVEGIGPWGVGHFGMNLLSQEGGYQNALDWWLGEEDMIYGLNMGIFAPVWPGREEDAAAFSFRAIAYGGRFGFTERSEGIEQWDGWLRSHNRILARVGPLAGEREILPDARGVLWRQRDESQVLFAFETFEYAADGQSRITRVTEDGESPLKESVFQTEPQAVYRILRR